MSELSNIERISEEMFANYHQMQHFITESSWDYHSLMDQVAVDVSKSLPQRKLTGLIIDESGWEKKGAYEYKYSFTNANLEQYTEKALAYMQAQRFFVEHCIK